MAEARGRITLSVTLAVVVPGETRLGVKVAELFGGAPCTDRRIGPDIACPAACTAKTKLAVPPGCMLCDAAPAVVIEKSVLAGGTLAPPIVTSVTGDRADRKFASPE